MPNEKYPHVNKANKYARDVVSGKIVACKWVKLACQRHLDDLKKEKKRNFLYKFDRAEGERFVEFAETFPHVKGEWARKKNNTLKLQPWQCFIWVVVFGWLRKSDGSRRFREVYAEIARKNGKSIQAAIVGLFMLTVDGEIGPEIFSGATTEKQALEVFRPAWLMANKADEFKDYFGIELGGTAKNPGNIYCLENDARFEAVIGKPGDGASPHCAIVDEYHEHKTSELYDTMLTGMGARSQPLLLIITTAGSNIAGPCHDKRSEACKVLEGTTKNEELFGIIFTIDDDDDWTDFKNWKKANPNLGISVKEDFLKARLQEGIQSSTRQNIVRCKHLNQWVHAKTAWMNMIAWKNCGDPSLSIDQFEGEPCWVPIDLASKIDIAAMMQLFRRGDHYYMFGKYYLPEAALEGEDKTHYQGWAKDGLLTITLGNIIDFSYIEDDLKEFRSRFEIQEVPYDPHQATQFATRMMDEGMPMVEYGASVPNFSEPMKEFEALVLSGKFHHNGDPVLTWMASNVVARIDAKECIYPRKEKPENKIDGIVAGIMGIGRAMLNSSSTGYVQQGVVDLEAYRR